MLADGVYALTAEGDPNVGAIEGEDFLVCFEALATPVAARRWLAKLREHTDKPVRYLVLVALPRRAGAGRQRVRRRGDRRAREDPRADRRARQAGLGVASSAACRACPRRPTRCPASPGPRSPSPTGSPSTSAATAATSCCSTAAAATPKATSSAWLPRAEDPLRRRPRRGPGRALHRRRVPPRLGAGTLDRVGALGAEALIGGRGAVRPRPGGGRRGDRADPRTSCDVMIREVGAVQPRGGTLKDAFDASHAALHRAVRALADLRALPAVRRVAAVGRAVRHRAAA